jgi:flagellar hook-basal body protein
VGNKLQGFSKDSTLSTPSSSVYKTVLEPMNIGNLNKIPKATSQTTFDLNLNGQDPVTYNTTANGGRQSASGIAFTSNNLKDMSYNGAPNYSTSKVVYDSLGGQHRMTVNYYKSQVNAPGAFPTKTAPNYVNYTNETTDWYAQTIMEDYDPATQTYYKSGSAQDSATNGTNNQNAMTANLTVAASVTGSSMAQVNTAINAAGSFGTPTTAVDAANSAYNVALSLGSTTAQAITARDAVWVAHGGVAGTYPNGAAATASTPLADFQAMTTSLQTSTVLSANDKTRLDAAYTSYNTTPWSANSARLASLFTVTNAAGAQTQPTTAAEAGQAATAAAVAMGLNASQASQAAAAAQKAFTTAAVTPAYTAAVTAYNAAVTAGGATPTPAQAATIAADAAAVSAITTQASFNAAFGTTGVITAIPQAVVQALRFDSTGKLLDFDNGGDFANLNGNTTPPTTASASQSWYFDIPNQNGTVGVTEAMTFTADLTKLTQYAGAYTIRGVTQDGYAAGDLVGVQVNKDGAIEARYSNGRSDVVAKLALANFSDQQGMQKLGSQMWAETAASGPRQLGNPQASGFGAVQAGALEYSNVDVTGELVNMIFMQKMYQASAQVISTDKTLTQTILQL